MATFLSGFRTYISYHVQANKAYLHTRILRIVDSMHQNIKRGSLTTDP